MNVQRITKIALFAALLALISPIAIPTSIVPFTLSSLMIYILSFSLKPVDALISVLVYILLGVIGLPVFSGYQAGLQVLTGPTGGFIIGYIPASFIISLLVSGKKTVLKYIYSFISGTLIIYMFGLLMFSFVMDLNFVNSLFITVIPFLIFDIVKMTLGIITCIILNKRFTNI